MFRFSHSPIAVLVAGLVTLVLGLGTAFTILPEWTPDPLPSRDVFRQKADETVQRLGLRKLDSFHIELTERGSDAGSTRTEREQFEDYLGKDAAAAWFENRDRTFYVIADTQVGNREGKQFSLDLKFTLEEDLIQVKMMPDELGTGMFQGGVTPGRTPAQVVSVLLGETETPGEPTAVDLYGSDFVVYPILESERGIPESINLVNPGSFPMLVANRVPGTVEQIAARATSFSIPGLLRMGWGFAARAGFALAIVTLLAVLLTRRSLGLKNGMMLAAIQFLLVIPPVIRGQQHLLQTIAMDLLFLASVGLVFIGWSASESWYRILSNEATTGLDHLREKVLGREEGRSLVAGWGAGAAIAGAGLVLAAIAHRMSWLSATSLSVDLSSAYQLENPWFSGVMVSIAVLLARSAGLRWFATDRGNGVTLVIGTLLLIPVVQVAPFPVAAALALALMALLVWTLRHYRVLGLLTSAVTAFSLPLVAFSLLHPVWQPLELFVTAVFSGAPLVVGFIGLRRGEAEGRERVATPMFMRRLEHERRLRYEMDLLARMQLGLLPNEPPHLEGWDFAVRSVLPTEVGGDFYEFIEDEETCLWVAMGDVSGHGYQCSIVHAMTKAALLSLVSARLRPAEIMDKLDQVLRHSGTARTFVALALMRIDVRTGEIVLSNAASPYPIVVSEGDVREIELPKLPLGHGPIQAYDDHHFTIDPGSAIVFWSDGLYEARDTLEDEYGYDRPGVAARRNLAGDATTIMESIFEDWTSFRGDAELEDDTTVLVIKREA